MNNHITEKTSLKGLNWDITEPNLKDTLFLVQKFELSEIIARILVNRNITDETKVSNYLEPKLKNLMPNPFLLKDMDKAAKRIIQSIKQKERVVVYADYDVDGASSSAVLIKFLGELGLKADLYVPCRFKEGYGPNKEAFMKLAKEYKLIITVDCGTVSFDPINSIASRKLFHNACMEFH